MLNKKYFTTEKVERRITMVTKNFYKMLKGLPKVGVYEVKLEWLEETLGSQPNSSEIVAEFIASKAPDAATLAEEVANSGVEDVFDQQTTVFNRDPDGDLALMDYQLKGMFKDSCGLLRRTTGTRSAGVKAYKKIIDGSIFIYERWIKYILEDGAEIGLCQRPLRASTAQGDRVALASSESLPAGTRCVFHVILMNSTDLPLLEEWLSYGAIHGFSQWRNSGKGSFDYELKDITEEFFNDKKWLPEK
jgi:hypothetical protein